MDSAPADTPPERATGERAGRQVRGDGIASWFRDRGAEKPGALDPSAALCHVVRAEVPSGEALFCEQQSTIDEWATVTRRMLYDVRSGRTLVLVNLIKEVAPVDGDDTVCGGARVRLRIELSPDGRSLAVVEDGECECAGRAEALGEEATDVRAAGRTRDAAALEYQAKEVESACAQLGAYEWQDHGFAPRD